MKDSVEPKTKRDAARVRDLFAEVSEGMKALAEERRGKRTLRTHTKNKALMDHQKFVTLCSRDSMKITVKACQLT